MAQPQKLEGKEDVLRLWYHENCRVFQDRLVNDEDRKWFVDLIRDKMASGFEMAMDDVVKDSTMIYGDFMVPSAENKIYGEVPSFDKVRTENVFHSPGGLMQTGLNRKRCLVQNAPKSLIDYDLLRYITNNISNNSES